MSDSETEFISDELLDWVSIGSGYYNESDRGLILISLSVIDERLAYVLKCSQFAKRKNALKKWVKRMNLSSKIDMAFILSLIDEKTHDALHLVRGIRNDMAHGTTFFEFSVPEYELFQEKALVIYPELKSISDKKSFFMVFIGLTFFAISREIRVYMGISEKRFDETWKMLSKFAVVNQMPATPPP